MFWLSLLMGCGPSGSPVRVAVLLGPGIDTDADRRLAHSMTEALSEIGFDVVTETAPLAGEDYPAEARAAMSRANAANAVVLAPRADQVRAGMIEGTHLWRVTLDAYVVHEDPAVPVASHSMSWAQEKHTAAQVEKRVTNTWVSATGAWATDALYQTPAVQRALTDQVSMKELEFAGNLQKKRRLVEDRRERASGYAQYCADQTEALSGFVDAEKVRCFGNPCGQYTALGVGADGHVLVQDTSRIPMFTVPLERSTGWSEPPERIFAIPMTGGEERPLLESANFYGFGNLQPGAEHAAVETFSSEGTAGIYGFSTRDGSRSLAVLYGPDERSVFSRVAPDGSRALACLTRGQGCFTDDGSGRAALRDYSVAEFVDVGGLRVFGQLDSGHLSLEDPAAPGAGPKRAERTRLSRVLGVHDGRIVAVSRDDDGTCFRLSVDPGSLAVTARDRMPVCLGGVQMLPDGRLVGTARATSPGDVPGDDEVVVWTAGSTELVVVTQGPFREEYPEVGPDGKRIVFQRRLESPPRIYDTKLYPRVVCVADTPAP